MRPRPVNPALRFAARCALALAASASLPAVARAGAPKIAVLREGLDEPAAARISAELAEGGFDHVELIDPDGALASDTLAIVRAARTGAGIEVCTRRAPAARRLRCEVVRPEPHAGASDATLPLRAVELVRAALLDVPRKRLRYVLPDADDPPEAPPPRPSLPRFGLEAAPAALFTSGHAPAPGVVIAARWMPARFIGAGAWTFVPLLPSRLSAPEGSATVRAAMIGGGLRLATRIASGPCVPSLELGAAGVWLHVAGDATPAYAARDVDRIVGGPYGRAGVSVDVARGFGLRADLLSGAAFPRPDIVFAGRTVTSWGRPFFIASIGVDLAW